VVIEHSGDSEIRVYKNGEKTFVTECHDGFNEKEMERLRNEKLLNPFEGKIACKSIRVVNSDFIEASDAFYIKYANGAKFAMTQSLGHNGGTGCAPQFWSCDFNMDTDAMRVIGFSDGISDIFGPHNDIIIGIDVDASYICSTAEFLWKKEWKFYTPDIDPLTKKAKLDENGQTLMRVAKQVFGEKGYDDLSCGVIQSFPLKKI
jgi:serine/threonine protein phosphatase PrpC